MFFIELYQNSITIKIMNFSPLTKKLAYFFNKNFYCKTPKKKI